MNDFVSILKNQAIDLAADQLRHRMQSGQGVRVSTKDAVAEHEASHAVMGTMIGLPIRRVEVFFKKGQWSGFTTYHQPDWLHRPGPGSRSILTPRGAFALGLHTLAGPMGEGDGAGDFFLDAIEMAEGVGYLHSAFVVSAFPDGTPSDRDDYYGPMMEFASSVLSLVPVMLDHCADSVGAMAERLVRTGRLAAHEVQQLTKDVPRVDLHEQFNALCGIRLLDEVPEGHFPPKENP